MGRDTRGPSEGQGMFYISKWAVVLCVCVCCNSVKFVCFLSHRQCLFIHLGFYSQPRKRLKDNSA